MLVAHDKVAPGVIVGERCDGRPVVRVPVHPGQALAARYMRDVDGDLRPLVSRLVTGSPTLTERDDLRVGAAMRTRWGGRVPGRRRTDW